MADRPIASALAFVPHITAYLDAVTRTLADIDAGKVLVQLIDFAPPEALPFLAQQNNVLGYKGYALCTNDDQRRTLLKHAPAINRKLGTPDSIERAIKAIGYPNAIVTERTGIKYNGLYKFNGAKKYRGGKWFFFDVEVFYSGALPDTQTQVNIQRLINKCKSTRSVLFNLKFTEV